jgi:hypothetical protein
VAGSALKDRDTNQIDVHLWMAQMLVPSIAPDDPFSALDDRLLGDQISGEILVDNLSTGVHKANVSVIIWRVGLEKSKIKAVLRNQKKIQIITCPVCVTSAPSCLQNRALFDCVEIARKERRTSGLVNIFRQDIIFYDFLLFL